MKLFKAIIFLFTLCLSSHFALGQNEMDLLRYSFTAPHGTARSMAMGNSFSALGADISVANVNPAGLAMIRKNEINFSPGIQINNTTSNHYGNRDRGGRANFNFQNFAYLIAIDTKDSDWVSSSLTFSFHSRYNTFIGQTDITGVNTESSLARHFASEAEGIPSQNFELDQPSQPFTGALAWWTFLIDPANAAETEYTTMVQGDVLQQKRIETEGRHSEFSFAYAANYRNKLMIGVNVGFPRIRFEQESLHYEEAADDNSYYPIFDENGNEVGREDFGSLAYREEMSVSSRALSGINATVGLLMLPNDWLRLGASFTTPTTITLEERYRASLDTEFITEMDNGDVYVDEYGDASSINVIDYRVNTPMRAHFSAGFVLGGKVLINAETEIVRYNGMQLLQTRRTNFNFDDTNNLVSDLFHTTANYRLGFEYRIHPAFSLRAGGGYFGSPYKSRHQTDNDMSRIMYSFGGGYRTGSFYFDVAFNTIQWSEDFYLYNPQIIQSSNLNRSITQVLTTVGYRF